MIDIDTQQAGTERAVRVRDDLLAALGHDLRNPLAPVSMVLDTLGRPGMDASTHAELIGMARRQMALALRLLDEVAELTAVLRGNPPLNLERLELALIVGDALSMWRAAEGGALGFEACGEIAHVRVDPVRMARALMRLIGFAVADDAGTAPMRVSAGAESGQALVRIEYGPRPYDGVAGQVFADPFTSAQPVPPSKLLPALRLWAATRLLDRHGGALRVIRETRCTLLASLPLVA